VLTRLTTDGQSAVADISSDGKLMAYRRFEPGKVMNAWVRQISGGTPHQVTYERDGVRSAIFSPDATHIAYTRTKDGRAYEIPALGGEARAIGEGGVVSYMPNGSSLLSIGDPAQLSFIDLHGGQPELLQPGLGVGWAAISPAGDRILLDGARKETFEADIKHWWLLTTATRSLKEVKGPVIADSQRGMPSPHAWLRDPDDPRLQWIYYAGSAGDSVNIYRSPVDDQGRIAPEIERLIFSTNGSFDPAVSQTGILLFNSAAVTKNLWKIPIGPATGKPRGERERITQDEGVSYNGVSISQEGQRIAYTKGDGQVYSRELPSGRETKLAEGYEPTISPDGSLVTFQRFEAGKHGIYVVESTGGGLRRVTVREPEFFGLWGISSNNQYLLYTERDPAPDHIGRIDLQTGEIKQVLSHPTYGLYHAYFSPDQRWVTFKMRITADRHQLFISP
jgi:hypothetical protein